eukprot:2727870-Rhodomonas_salina.1
MMMSVATGQCGVPRRECLPSVSRLVASKRARPPLQITTSWQTSLSLPTPPRSPPLTPPRPSNPFPLPCVPRFSLHQPSALGPGPQPLALSLRARQASH